MDWKSIQALKDEHRQAARLRPIEQKLALLERLRDRTRDIASVRPRPDGIGERSILMRSADPAMTHRSAPYYCIARGGELWFERLDFEAF